MVIVVGACTHSSHFKVVLLSQYLYIICDNYCAFYFLSTWFLICSVEISVYLIFIHCVPR